MAKKFNGTAKWIIVGFSILTLAFNSGILYNDVKHLKSDVKDIKQDLRSLREYIMFEVAVSEEDTNHPDSSFSRLRQPSANQAYPQPIQKAGVKTTRNERNVGAGPVEAL